VELCYCDFRQGKMETVGVGRFDAGTEYRFEKVLSSLSRRGRISMFPFVFWIHSQTQVEVGIGSLSLGWPTNSCKNVKPKLEAVILVASTRWYSSTPYRIEL